MTKWTVIRRAGRVTEEIEAHELVIDGGCLIFRDWDESILLAVSSHEWDEVGEVKE